MRDGWCRGVIGFVGEFPSLNGKDKRKKCEQKFQDHVWVRKFSTAKIFWLPVCFYQSINASGHLQNFMACGLSMCLRYICTDIPSVCWCKPVNRFIHSSDISGFLSKAEINHRPSCESHLRITKRRRLLRPFYPQFGLLQSGISRHGQRSDCQHHCHSQTP